GIPGRSPPTTSPEELRRTAVRRPLSRLEQADLVLRGIPTVSRSPDWPLDQPVDQVQRLAPELNPVVEGEHRAVLGVGVDVDRQQLLQRVEDGDRPARWRSEP